ncbi:DUF397 domain-containing protein [Streptomyces sp. NBC_00102]|uniref:DUF397 domain-containing protein n=1 Tax=Streptomyces sp. NBC_00102 TaxID=2975652 RepID=UPI00224DB377|nr:DUF397 domain-containing protein [Streptomyces sp. NBC_00102]MCX5398356.1 DUF397 domain-containing protein [Streptomyces sp. NBC_00102]
MNYEFTKSSYSSMNSDCVEVARNVPGSVAVRDSKRPHGPVLVVAPAAWAAFSAELCRTESAGS